MISGVFCKQCGAELSNTNLTCTKCGHKLKLSGALSGIDKKLESTPKEKRQENKNKVAENSREFEKLIKTLSEPVSAHDATNPKKENLRQKYSSESMSEVRIEAGVRKRQRLKKNLSITLTCIIILTFLIFFVD